MTSQPQASGVAGPSATGPLGAGAVVGDYTLLAPIGEGGMGLVHLARHVDGHRVALKLLRPHVVGDDEGRRRLAREVSSLRRVKTRWVAEVVDADPWAPVPYIATRYVPGLSLHHHVHSEGPIEGVEQGGDLIWLAAGLAEGLSAVHAAGVLHRDVKPANVLMEGRSPILIDFGLARVADDPKLTHTGWLLGTPGYLAPEILYGEDVTAAADIHSWAATVAFAATGRPPFGRGPSMAVMDRVRRGEHDLTGVPAPLRDLLDAALDPEVARRPRLDQILAWLRPRAVRSPRATPTAAPPPWATGAPPAAEDPFTLPLVLAAQAAPDTPASQAVPVEADRAYDWSEDGWDDDTPAAGPPDQDATPTVMTRVVASGPDFEDANPTTRLTVVPPADPTRMFTQHQPIGSPPPAAYSAQPWQDPAQPWQDRGHREQHPPGDHGADPRRVPAAERFRRGVLVGGGFAAVAAALAAAPWLTLVALVVGVWLLRAASAAASGVGDRRERRGRRWWDGPVVLVQAPWHLLRTTPSTTLLLVWSGGLALAAALVCYAVGVPLPALLAVSGATLAGSLWWGPGSRRVRSPIRRVTDPLAAGNGGWLGALTVLAGVALVLGLAVQSQGGVVSWAPATGAPFNVDDLPGAR